MFPTVFYGPGVSALWHMVFEPGLTFSIRNHRKLWFPPDVVGLYTCGTVAELISRRFIFFGYKTSL
jgi:hypothetical protein